MNNSGDNVSSTSHGEVEPIELHEIGKRISRVRGSVSQRDFARSLCTHLNTIGQYERGQRMPVLSVILKICSVYQVSLEWLMTGKGEMRPTTDNRANLNDERIDSGKLKSIIAAVMSAIEQAHVHPTSAQIAEIVSGLYELIPPGVPIPSSAVIRFINALK